MKKFTKYVAVALAGLVVAGCAAIDKNDAYASYGSGGIVYFEVNNPNYLNGEKAISWLENESASWEKANICQMLGNEFCDKNYRTNLVLHNGNIKTTLSKILKLNVLVPKEIKVSKGDIVKAKFVAGGNAKTNVAHFIGVADKNDCHWDGSGVICKSGWDWHKDLPKGMQ